MNKIVERIYSKVILITSILTFGIWKIGELIQPNIENIINSRKMSIIITYIVGIVVSYSFYIQVNRIIIILCEKFDWIKRIFLRDGFFKGKWMGVIYCEDDLRFVIMDIEQNVNSIFISGNSYSMEGNYLGSMNSQSVNFNLENKKMWASYIAFSNKREYLMDGLINVNYQLDKKGIPVCMKGYAYQLMVSKKYVSIFYKSSFNGSITSAIDYFRWTHLDEIKKNKL